MKFETTPRFDSDFRALPRDARVRFREVVPTFSAACDGYVSDPGSFTWPAALRVSRMRGAPGVWEMTWSFSSPDGRATFEFVTVDDERCLRWRRVGDHVIYRQP